jgi:hypothetical protein
MDNEGVLRWCFAKGQKPRKWFVGEEAELHFYNRDGNSTDPSHNATGIIWGVCPNCQQAVKGEGDELEEVVGYWIFIITFIIVTVIL